MVFEMPAEPPVVLRGFGFGLALMLPILVPAFFVTLTISHLRHEVLYFEVPRTLFSVEWESR